MADVYKVCPERWNGDIILFHSAADIVSFNSNKIGSLHSTDVESAIIEVEQNSIQRSTELNQLLEKNVNELNTKLIEIANSTDGKAELVELVSSIPLSGFKEGTAPYTQTIQVLGVLESDIPIIGLNPTGDVSAIVKQIDSWCSVSRIQTMDDKLVITCLESKPLVDLPIQIKIIRQPPKKINAGTDSSGGTINPDYP